MVLIRGFNTRIARVYIRRQLWMQQGGWWVYNVLRCTANSCSRSASERYMSRTEREYLALRVFHSPSNGPLGHLSPPNGLPYPEARHVRRSRIWPSLNSEDLRLWDPCNPQIPLESTRL